MEQKYLLSAAEAWKFSGLPRDKIYSLIRSGQLKTIRVGQRHKIHRLELEKFLDEAAQNHMEL